MYETVYGSKYEKGLDTAEIAKRIRQDIKAAIAAGELPKDLKTSVRIERFAGGSSIDVRVTGGLEGIGDLCDAGSWREAETSAGQYREHPGQYAQTAKDGAWTPIYEKLKAIHASYNYDGSDTMSDYFHVNYYGHVELDWKYRIELLTAEYERWQAGAEARAKEVVCLMKFAHGDYPAKLAITTVGHVAEIDPTDYIVQYVCDADCLPPAWRAVGSGDMLSGLREVRAEITRINEAHGETVFNPAATDAINEIISTLEGKNESNNRQERA